jgi:hypothetical protein
MMTGEVALRAKVANVSLHFAKIAAGKPSLTLLRVQGEA